MIGRPILELDHLYVVSHIVPHFSPARGHKSALMFTWQFRGTCGCLRDQDESLVTIRIQPWGPLLSTNIESHMPTETQREEVDPTSVGRC